MKRLLGIGLTVMVCCVFAVVASGEAEALTLNVTSARVVSGGVEVAFAWTPAAIDFPGGTAGGITFPPMTLTPEKIHIVEYGNGQTNYLQVGIGTSATLTRPSVTGFQYVVLYEGHHPYTGRYWSASSNAVTVVVNPPATPTLSNIQMGTTAGVPFYLWFSTGANTVIVQIQQSTSSSFNTNVTEYWPRVAPERVTINAPGEYFFRMRAWNALPEQGGQSSGWSNIVSTVVSSPLATPTITPLGTLIAGQSVPVKWSSVSGAFIYQLVMDTTSAFGSANERQFWPQSPTDTIPNIPIGTYYFKVRAWSNIPENGGAASWWSQTVTATVTTFPTPVINPVNETYAGQVIPVTWNAITGAKMYQVQFDTQNDFASSNKKEFWPQSAIEQIPGQTAGTYYIRVRAWTDAPENGGVRSVWSSVVTITVLPSINTPAFIASEWSGIVKQTVTVDWSDVAGAVIYQGVIAEDAAFTKEIAQFWPGNSYEVVTLPRPGKLYTRVRAWSALPENGGVATAWSVPAALRVTPAAPILLSQQGGFSGEPLTIAWVDDEPVGTIEYSIAVENDVTGDVNTYTSTATSVTIDALSAGNYSATIVSRLTCDDGIVLESSVSEPLPIAVIDNTQYLLMLEKQAFLSLLETTYPNGLTRDRYHADRAGVTTPLNDETDAVSTAATGFYLSALTVGVENGWITRSAAYNRAVKTLTTMSKVANYNGFFYHYMKPDGTPSDAPYREVSSIDTALFLAGALQAGEYFGGSVKTLTNTLYRRVKWGSMFNWYTYQFHMGWSESKGLFNEYNSYCEAFLLYFLAVGSPTYPVPAYSFYNTARLKGSYGGGEDMIFTVGGQLFTYQYPLTWIDLRVMKDALKTDWWKNAKTAVLANRQFCIDQPNNRYSELFWGLSPCDGPDGYKAYGAAPSLFHEEDGTIAPYALAAAMPFAPAEALEALQHLYRGWKDRAWGYYGLVDGVNAERDWGGKYYIAIDQGALLLMLENHRTQLMWKKFMINTHVKRALTRLRFEGFGKAYAVADGFEGDSFWTPETTFGWWDSEGDAVYQRSSEHQMSLGGRQAMRIDYNKNGYAWSCMGAFIAPTNPLKNFVGKKKLIFWAAGNGKLLVKLRDRALKEYGFKEITVTGPNSWTYCEFDLTKVTGINKADIDNILFFIEPGQTSGSGTIWLDDIVIE
jgi:hypothetical protein